MTAGCSAAFHTYSELVTSGPLAEFQPSATDYLRLRRIEVSVLSPSTNNTLALGIGTPAASGTGRPMPVALLQEDAGDNHNLPGLQIFADWTVLPTAPTSFFRRASAVAITSSGCVIAFDFAGGLGIAHGGSLVLWAISVGVGALLFDISVAFDG